MPTPVVGGDTGQGACRRKQSHGNRRSVHPYVCPTRLLMTPRWLWLTWFTWAVVHAHPLPTPLTDVAPPTSGTYGTCVFGRRSATLEGLGHAWGMAHVATRQDQCLLEGDTVHALAAQGITPRARTVDRNRLTWTRDGLRGELLPGCLPWSVVDHAGLRRHRDVESVVPRVAEGLDVRGPSPCGGSLHAASGGGGCLTTNDPYLGFYPGTWRTRRPAGTLTSWGHNLTFPLSDARVLSGAGGCDTNRHWIMQREDGRVHPTFVSAQYDEDDGATTVTGHPGYQDYSGGEPSRVLDTMPYLQAQLMGRAQDHDRRSAARGERTLHSAVPRASDWTRPRDSPTAFNEVVGPYEHPTCVSVDYEVDGEAQAYRANGTSPWLLYDVDVWCGAPTVGACHGAPCAPYGRDLCLHGHLQGMGQCRCDDGWGGPQCAQALPSSVAGWGPDVFTWTACPDPDYFYDLCSGRGRCHRVHPSYGPVCDCYPGWFGNASYLAVYMNELFPTAVPDVTPGHDQTWTDPLGVYARYAQAHQCLWWDGDHLTDRWNRNHTDGFGTRHTSRATPTYPYVCVGDRVGDDCDVGPACRAATTLGVVTTLAPYGDAANVSALYPTWCVNTTLDTLCTHATAEACCSARGRWRCAEELCGRAPVPRCRCQPGWGGALCDTPACPVGHNGQVCGGGGRGTCVVHGVTPTLNNGTATTHGVPPLLHPDTQEPLLPWNASYTGVCVCADGYGGRDGRCEVTSCPRDAQGRVCGPRGDCVYSDCVETTVNNRTYRRGRHCGTGTCVCQSGWAVDTATGWCTRPVCPTHPLTGEVCAGLDVCADGDPPVCQCWRAWANATLVGPRQARPADRYNGAFRACERTYGQACQGPTDLVNGTMCSGRGYCVPPHCGRGLTWAECDRYQARTLAPSCVCDRGWAGTYCERPEFQRELVNVYAGGLTEEVFVSQGFGPQGSDESSFAMSESGTFPGHPEVRCPSARVCDCLSVVLSRGCLCSRRRPRLRRRCSCCCPCRCPPPRLLPCRPSHPRPSPRRPPHPSSRCPRFLCPRPRPRRPRWPCPHRNPRR